MLLEIGWSSFLHIPSNFDYASFMLFLAILIKMYLMKYLPVLLIYSDRPTDLAITRWTLAVNHYASRSTSPTPAATS